MKNHGLTLQLSLIHNKGMLDQEDIEKLARVLATKKI